MSDQDERTAELEAKVERLEATVQGLTEELVEVHDRLETLEGEASGSRGRDQSPVRGRDRSADEADDVSDADASRTHDEDKNDGAKSDETQDEDETGDDSDAGDDIIVA